MKIERSHKKSKRRIKAPLSRSKQVTGQVDFFENRLHEAVRQLFGELDAPVLAEICAIFEWVNLPGGGLLFRQGEADDSMYVLVSGRLKVLRNRKTGEVEHFGEIAAGEIVGEMALITGEPRSADIIAMRDSVLARISKEQFETLVQHYPRALIQLTKTILERMRQRMSTKRAKKKITNLCVLPVSELTDSEEFVRNLCEALTLHGSVKLLDSRTVNELFEHSGIAETTHDESRPYRRLSSWFDEQESNHRFVVYLTDKQDSEWTRRCLRQSDEILLVADSNQSPDLHPVEQLYLNGGARLTQADQILALVHPPGANRPVGTRNWLAQRSLHYHHHIRSDHPADFARLARFISGNAIGLVLSGGAAKGFAHIGVFRALEEAGIPVDFVGGTSIGAIMGAFIARSWTGSAIRSYCRAIFRKNPTSDFNLVPRVSIFKGKKLENLLHATFGDLEIEDLWLNFFCVSCNLTRTNPHIHKTGSLAVALRASISIPGVFPPTEIDNDLYVDGGVSNNMPVDVMSQLGVGSIIAVDLQMYHQLAAEQDQSAVRRRRLPNLLFVVMESSLLSGRYLSQEYKKQVDLYFNPPLRGFSLIDWNKFDKIEAIGYAHAKEVLAFAKGIKADGV